MKPPEYNSLRELKHRGSYSPTLFAVEKTFGKLIKEARKDRGYSQRELAIHLGVDFTYLSKLENDRADYAPKEDVIRALARNLSLDEDELVFLAGRIPQKYEQVLKENPKEMLALFRRMENNPDFAREISRITKERKRR